MNLFIFLISPNRNKLTAENLILIFSLFFRDGRHSVMVLNWIRISSVLVNSTHFYLCSDSSVWCVTNNKFYFSFSDVQRLWVLFYSISCQRCVGAQNSQSQLILFLAQSSILWVENTCAFCNGIGYSIIIKLSLATEWKINENRVRQRIVLQIIEIKLREKNNSSNNDHFGEDKIAVKR